MRGRDFCQRFKPHVVAFNGLDMAASCKPPVTVHDEGDMLRDGALAEGIDEKLLGAGDNPFDRRRREKPPTSPGGAVEGRGHCGRVGGGVCEGTGLVVGGGGRRDESSVVKCVVSGGTRTTPSRETMLSLPPPHAAWLYVRWRTSLAWERRPPSPLAPRANKRYLIITPTAE